MSVNIQLKSFFDELVSDVTCKFSDQIVSMVLFGSATTGEWIRGKSDIDCLIIIKNKKQCQAIEKYLNKLLLQLDSKFDLKLTPAI